MRTVAGTPSLGAVQHPGTDLRALGWDPAWESLASSYGDDCRPGRVARVDRGLCTVITEDGVARVTWGSDVLEGVAADPQASPCTGDWALIREWPDGRATVEALLPRRTAIVRAEASGTSTGQVLAANVGVVAIVVALHPEPNLGRLERMLALAWESGAQPLVLLTKADLVAEAELIADDVEAAAPGVDVICCSTVTGEGIDLVRERLAGTATMVMLGISGHGKSSLTNALLGADALTVRAIRSDGKGRHTSVRRELIVMPAGGAVIDTPGLRGVGLQEGGDGMASTFPDITRFASECRFSDCLHDAEPGCAVQAAIAEGALAVRRLDSWRKLQREVAWMASRSDSRLRAEQRKKWKRITMANRHSGRGAR